MPRLRVGLPEVAYALRRWEQRTSLKNSVAQPQPPGTDESNEDECEHEQHTGSQQGATQKSRRTVGEVVRLVSDGTALQGTDGDDGGV